MNSKEKTAAGVEEIVTVSVRSGVSDQHRVITFQRPAKISTRMLLENGIAIDGNSGRIEIALSRNYVFDGGEHTMLFSRSDMRPDNGIGPKLYDSLADALFDVQSDLVEFLGKHDYAVEFE